MSLVWSQPVEIETFEPGDVVVTPEIFGALVVAGVLVFAGIIFSQVWR